MNDGALVPDALVLDMLKEAVNKLNAPRLLLDGFPRTLPQARALESITSIDAVRAVSQCGPYAPLCLVYVYPCVSWCLHFFPPLLSVESQLLIKI